MLISRRVSIIVWGMGSQILALTEIWQCSRGLVQGSLTWTTYHIFTYHGCLFIHNLENWLIDIFAWWTGQLGWSLSAKCSLVNWFLQMQEIESSPLQSYNLRVNAGSMQVCGFCLVIYVSVWHRLLGVGSTQKTGHWFTTISTSLFGKSLDGIPCLQPLLK